RPQVLNISSTVFTFGSLIGRVVKVAMDAVEGAFTTTLLRVIMHEHHGTSLQGADIKVHRLELSSFWGLFVVCGGTCFLALALYTVLMIRQCSEEPEAMPSREKQPEDISVGGPSGCN
ncbi:hypothetical protein CARUB_v10018451mg, partial [Capsella rubella]